MPATKTKEFLDASGVKYVVISHSPAYTAQEIASSAHVPGKELAKTVMVLLDGRMAMAVVPAPRRVDMDALKTAAGATTVELAGEQRFRDFFPDCDAGAMPPFGNLYGMEVFADARLAEDARIVFNAGSHRELMQLAFHDFQQLVKPRLVKIT